MTDYEVACRVDIPQYTTVYVTGTSSFHGAVRASSWKPRSASVGSRQTGSGGLAVAGLARAGIAGADEEL
jgi:hypothetical protein